MKQYKIVYFGLFLTFVLLVFSNMSTINNFLNQTRYKTTLQFSENTKASCLKKENPYQRMACLKPYLETKTKLLSAKEAVAETVVWKDQGFIPTCHIVGHYIGDANLVKNNYDVGKAIVSCSTSCDEGCIHGVMEGYIVRSESFEKALSEAPSLCDSVSFDKVLQRQCYHGLGHGLLRHGSIEVSEALNLCKKTNDNYYSSVCEGGVLMEYAFEYLAQNSEEFIKNLPEVCNQFLTTQDKEISSWCIFQIGGAIAIHTNNNKEKGGNICKTLPLEYQQECINSLSAHIDTIKEEK